MTDQAAHTTAFIPVKHILANPRQPRTYFDPAELADLAQSIREVGMINPITVEGPHKNQAALRTKEKKAGGLSTEVRSDARVCGRASNCAGEAVRCA